jgi:murein DD-endopeptidase MepM/ murein hydrolase activator NlpD
VNQINPSEGGQGQNLPPSSNHRRYTIISWGVTFCLVVAMLTTILWQPWKTDAANSIPTLSIPAGASSSATLPEYKPLPVTDSILRLANDHTIAPQRPREEVQDYTVSKGDSVFGISQKFNLKPETILWANYVVLNDSPDMISIGQALKIPPTNGVLYKWKDGDTLEAIATQYKAKADDIVSYPGNQLDMTKPTVKPGTLLMIPGGSREFRQWVIPTIPRGPAGVLKTVLGAGACDTNAGGAMGSGHFIWPVSNHYLSGNDYWSGHLAIDIAAFEGMGIFAADGGVVVYAGWSNGGYGNMVMIDHGTGYQTLYAHMSSVIAHCAQSVGQGTMIGLAGTTGNSTGPHLHFEVRYLGGFVNPWTALPPP